MRRFGAILTVGAVGLLSVLARAPSMAQDATPPAAPATDEFRQTQDIIERMQNRIKDINDASAARTKDFEFFNKKIAEILGILAEQRDKSTDLQSDISVLSDLLKIEREKSTGLQKELGELAAQITATTAKLGKTSGRLKEAAGRHEKASKELEETKKTLAATLTRFAETSGELAETTGRLDKALVNLAANSGKAGEIAEARLKAEADLEDTHLALKFERITSKVRLQQIEDLKKAITSLNRQLRDTQNRLVRRRRSASGK